MEFIVSDSDGLWGSIRIPKAANEEDARAQAAAWLKQERN